MTLRGKTAVVTGAASGIGLATARLLAREGARVAICDRDEDRLARIAAELEAEGQLCVAEATDVSHYDAVERFAARVHEQVSAVDLLVNNAGIAVMGRFYDVPIEEWDRVLGVNLNGVAYCCRAFLPAMIAAGRGGQIVNVASMAGYAATTRMASYHASKFGVIGLSEALRLDLHSHGIGVTAICPGVIDTAITQSSRSYGISDAFRGRISETFRRRGYAPERVARAILRAAIKNPKLQPVSPEAHVLYWVSRFFPDALDRLSHAVDRRIDES